MTRTSDTDDWDRHLLFWHVGFVLVVGLCTTLAVAEPTAGRWYGVAAEIGMIVAYASLSRRAYDEDSALGWPLTLTLVLAALFGVAAFEQDYAGFLLFALVPVTGRALAARLRLSLAVIIGMMALLAASILAGDGLTADSVVTIVGTVLPPAALSVLITVWVNRIAEQSARRAMLVAELERTRVQLAAERHEAGIRDERERLSAEIHDTLAQGFTSILMLSQAARAGLGSTDAGDRPRLTTVGGQLDIIAATARENLAEARSLVAALAPADLAGDTLAGALGRLAERLRRDSDLAVTLEVSGLADWRSPELDVVLLRVAQEALHNVRKHAAAETVHIALCYDQDRVVLSVRDDGRGFDPGLDTGGFGLRGSQVRTEALGGLFTVEPADPGTVLRAELPAPGQQSGEEETA